MFIGVFNIGYTVFFWACYYKVLSCTALFTIIYFLFLAFRSWFFWPWELYISIVEHLMMYSLWCMLISWACGTHRPNFKTLTLNRGNQMCKNANCFPGFGTSNYIITPLETQFWIYCIICMQINNMLWLNSFSFSFWDSWNIFKNT